MFKPIAPPKTAAVNRRKEWRWLLCLVTVAVMFIPLAYKVNGIDDEITKTVLLLLGSLYISSDGMGFLHRGLTEFFKSKEKNGSTEAPEQRQVSEV